MSVFITAQATTCCFWQETKPRPNPEQPPKPAFLSTDVEIQEITFFLITE